MPRRSPGRGRRPTSGGTPGAASSPPSSGSKAATRCCRATARRSSSICAPSTSARARGRGPKELWRPVREEVAHLPPVPLAKLIDHIDHMARVAGVDHVCLGSDFDGVPATPAGLEDVSKLPAITAALAKRGYAPADVEKILGGNLLRVLEANEPP